jgi:hypothetical protein
VGGAGEVLPHAEGQYPHQLDLLASLHGFALMEALIMHNLTPEQIGIDFDALSKIIRPEHYLKHHSMEELVRQWAQQHNLQELREVIDRVERSSNAPGKPPPSQD